MRSIRIPPPGPQRRMARTDIAAPSLNTLRLARAPFARRRTGVARPCWRSRAARLRHGTQGRRGRARRHPPSALPLACCPRAPRGGVRAPARACGTQGSAHTPRTQTCDSPQEPPRDVTVYPRSYIPGSQREVNPTHTRKWVICGNPPGTPSAFGDSAWLDHGSRRERRAGAEGRHPSRQSARPRPARGRRMGRIPLFASCASFTYTFTRARGRSHRRPMGAPTRRDARRAPCRLPLLPACLPSPSLSTHISLLINTACPTSRATPRPASPRHRRHQHAGTSACPRARRSQPA